MLYRSMKLNVGDVELFSLTCGDCGDGARFTTVESAVFHVVFVHGHRFCGLCSSTFRTAREKAEHDALKHAAHNCKSERSSSPSFLFLAFYDIIDTCKKLWCARISRTRLG